MRQVFFWMHLGSGVLISVLVIFFSVTGELLAYERPILHMADEHSYRVDPNRQQTARMNLDTLVAAAAAAVPAPIEMVTTHRNPQLPAEIQTTRRTLYFADPYSGKITGPASPELRGFFAQVTALHRWFGLSNTHHAVATAIKGATALLLLFMLVSGVILWIPRYWTRGSLRRAVVPQIDWHGRARNLNWHKVTGFWTGLPLAIVVLTGVVMAYPWANAQLFRLAGSPLPSNGAIGDNAHRRPGEGHSQHLPRNLDEAFAVATSNANDWQSASLRLPPDAAGLRFVVDRSDGGHPEKREQVLIDPGSLRVLRREPFAALNRGQRWRSWVRFVHTGEAGGWWGETLAAFAAGGAIVLSVTGVLLSFDRLRRRRRISARAAAV